MPAVKVEIVRFVDEHQPGFVECRLTDASGALHTFIEKVPVVTDESLWTDPKYPCTGAIACRLNGEFRDSAGRLLVRIDTEEPHGIESTLGESSFVVLFSQVIGRRAGP